MYNDKAIFMPVEDAVCRNEMISCYTTPDKVFPLDVGRVTLNGIKKEEMQRLLNREAEKGSTEYEVLKALADIFGMEFPGLKQREKAE